ncbi:Conserved oligomeric Golgi complex subunit 2 [Boothiomyces macroporosus]|uniref:Conserved oligomeric Golgi complex subunit 2 n=1 Tax=Boothiomyces macroporosus TaxID=261099 RepID=A0AAD5UQ72_9FUNG|nr:Conserved oligomeric Golgi complex subunit 2 [Boothiomyces macroporosus]
MNELSLSDFNDEFQLLEFINSKKQIPNKKMIEELSKISRQLQQELYQLINNDYQLFINLSLNLVGMDTLIFELKKPLLNLKQEYLEKTKEYDEKIIHLKSQLMKKNDIKIQKQALSNYLNIHESFAKIESLLNDKQAARISIELNQLEYLIKKNTMNVDAVNSQNQLLKKKFVDQISTDLKKVLLEIIDLDSFDDEEKRASVTQIQDNPSVSTLGLGTPTGSEIIHNQELLEIFRILVTIDQVGIADKIISQILVPFLQKEPSFETILSLLETRLSPIIQTSLVAFKGCNYNLLQEIVKPILISLMKNKQMFQVVDPKSFHQVYKKSTHFIDRLSNFVDPEIFKEYQKRWQLSVYFQLCHNDIVSDFEKEETKYTALISALEKLWCDDVFIFSIGHRFWRTTVLLVKRFTMLIVQSEDSSNLNTQYKELKQVQDKLVSFFRIITEKLNLVDASLEYVKKVYDGIINEIPVEPIKDKIINLQTQECFEKIGVQVGKIPGNLQFIGETKTPNVSTFLKDLFTPISDSEWKPDIIKNVLQLYTEKSIKTLSEFKKIQESLRKFRRQNSNAGNELEQMICKQFELDVADLERQVKEAGCDADFTEIKRFLSEFE